MKKYRKLQSFLTAKGWNDVVAETIQAWTFRQKYLSVSRFLLQHLLVIIAGWSCCRISDRFYFLSCHKCSYTIMRNDLKNIVCYLRKKNNFAAKLLFFLFIRSSLFATLTEIESVSRLQKNSMNGLNRIWQMWKIQISAILVIWKWSTRHKTRESKTASL